MNEAHVIPVNDLLMHEANDTCICCPRRKFSNDGLVIVHQALDGRSTTKEQS